MVLSQRKYVNVEHINKERYNCEWFLTIADFVGKIMR